MTSQNVSRSIFEFSLGQGIPAWITSFKKRTTSGAKVESRKSAEQKITILVAFTCRGRLEGAGGQRKLVLNRFLELFSLPQLSPNRNKLSCVSCALIILLLEEHRARFTTNISRCSCQTGSSVGGTQTMRMRKCKKVGFH